MTPEEYKKATPEQKAAERRRGAEEFARRIMESRGISVAEHARRIEQGRQERETIQKEEGLEEES